MKFKYKQVLKNPSLNGKITGRFVVRPSVFCCSITHTHTHTQIIFFWNLQSLAANSPPKEKALSLTKPWSLLDDDSRKFCEIWPRISLQRKKLSSFSVDWKLFPLEANSWPNFAKFRPSSSETPWSLSVDWKLSLWRPIRGQISQNFGCRRQEDLKLLVWTESFFLWRLIRGQISQNSGRHLQKHLESTLKLEVFLTTTAEILRNLATN